MSDMNQKQPKSGRGGARPGSGRPKGSTDKVSVDQILHSLEHHSGQTYAEVLATDFMAARTANDRSTVMKYHNLILNKVAPTLQSIEVGDSDSVVEAKQQSFAAAIALIQGSDERTK